MNLRKPVILSIFLIIVLGFAVYGNSLAGQFIWDDGILIVNNEYIKHLRYLPDIFLTSVGAGAGQQYVSYRPLQTVSYMADYFLWRLDPRGYHLTNILLHISAALSLYWLLKILFQDRRLAFLTAVLFLVHPVHTEAVAYISGRADPMALVFMLLSFIFYIKSPPSKISGSYFLMGVSYVLALLSRENSLILPLLLLLYHYVFKDRVKTREFLSLIGLTAVYVLLRLTVLRELLSYATYSTTLAQRLPGVFVALANYIKLLFFPFDLHMEYGRGVFRWSDPKVFLGAMILLLLALRVSKSKKNDRIVLFSIFWFLITLFPLSNILPNNAFMAEHWLYVPSIGFFLLVARVLTALYRTERFRTVAIGITACVIIFYSFLTVRQNYYWSDPFVFYKTTLHYAPDSVRARNNLGNIYKDHKKIKEAIASYKQAIAVNPNYAPAYTNLAIVLAEAGDQQGALGFLKRALAIEAGRKGDRANLAATYNNLGALYEDMGKIDQAVDAYKKSVEINPRLAPGYNSLGRIAYSRKKPWEAVVWFQKAVHTRSDYAGAYRNLGIVYLSLQKRAEAISSFEAVLKLDPGDIKVLYHLGQLYAEAGRNEEAIAAYERLLKLDPDSVPVRERLADIYGQQIE